MNDDENWTNLEDAYGPASEIPALLEQLAPDPRDDVWGELWSRICHQGSVYSASFAALPALTAAASSWAPSARAMVLTLAGAILSGEAQSPTFAGMRARYGSEVSTLRELAAESLRSQEVSREDFIYLLESAMAFDAIPIWNTNFDRLVDGEFQASCPSCETLLFVAIGDHGYFTSEDDYALKADVKKEQLMASSRASLDGLSKWIYDTAVAAGQKEVAEQITYLFGNAKCVRCGTQFDVAARVAAEAGA